MVQIISGKRITEEKIKSAAKCAVYGSSDARYFT